MSTLSTLTHEHRFWSITSLRSEDCRLGCKATIEAEATTHPLRDNRFELGRSLLPDAVTGLEDVQPCMRQSFAQKRRVSSEAVRVVPSNHDCHRYLDRRQARRKYYQVFRVRANECRGPRQAIAFVRRQIIVADEGRHGVPANRPQKSADHFGGIQRCQHLRFDHRLEGALNNEWVHRGAGTHYEAAEEFWPHERGKKDRR